MRRRTVLAAMMCSAAMVSSACQSPGDPAPKQPARPTVLLYDMNEAVGATVMSDTGGTAVSGAIGTDVVTGVESGGATGYRFPRVDPRTTVVRPGHLAQIPDSAAVDPGDAAYSVEIRYLTRAANGSNLVQKGQATSPGGQFKIQVDKGNPQCYFKGDRGKVGAGSSTRLDDGAWHTLRCSRTSSAVSLYVDGVLEKESAGQVGTLDNTFPMTIGGKARCDMVKVECDYFDGLIDYLKITKG